MSLALPPEWWREPSDDHIDFETDQLDGQIGNSVSLSFRRSKLKSNVLPFDVPEIAQPLPKHSPKLFRIGIANDQHADRRHLRLLRCAGKRPPCGCTAEKRDELAPPHSITSSASASSIGGIAKPSALAVFKLMTRSNLVGCSTARSAGFAPRRILSRRFDLHPSH